MFSYIQHGLFSANVYRLAVTSILFLILTEIQVRLKKQEQVFSFSHPYSTSKQPFTKKRNVYIYDFSRYPIYI